MSNSEVTTESGGRQNMFPAETKPYIDETSVTKILGSIHEKLKTLIQKDGLDLVENENRKNSSEINKVETDQQELF